MNRLLISVDDMANDDVVMVSFWHTFIDKFDEIKAVVERAVASAKIKKDHKRTVNLWSHDCGVDFDKEITDVVGNNPAPYYFTLDVFPSDCGVWAEYNDCVRLNVHTCNVGG